MNQPTYEELNASLLKQLEILGTHPDFNESCTLITIFEAMYALEELKQQRDELLNALEFYVDMDVQCQELHETGVGGYAEENARKVIAEVTK